MNPVLLKPESEVGSQVVVQGGASPRCARVCRMKPQLMAPVLESFHRLKAAHDLVIVEGAGSPAEVNLRAGDIANMGFACAAQVPVVLAGDIDRGGVIAQIIGTRRCCRQRMRRWCAAFSSTSFAVILAVRRWLSPDRAAHRLARVRRAALVCQAHLLPAEDALDLGAVSSGGRVKVAALALSRIANFDDLDPLAQEPDIDLVMVRAGQAIPGDTKLVILPGSKSTRGDLAFLRAGVGCGSGRACAARRACAGHLRRLSDAGQR
jgi:adenosylcobyric acid synthase